jgi:hypothetical protein
MRNFSDKFVEETNTHNFCSVTLFSGDHAVYEIMWKNMVVRQATDCNIIRYMRFACWINKAFRVDIAMFYIISSLMMTIYGRNI